jgi:hypothetical protein
MRSRGRDLLILLSFDASNSQDTVASLGGRLVDSDISADEVALSCPSAVSRTKRQKEEEARQAPSTAPIEVQTQHALVRNTPWLIAVSKRTEDVYPPIMAGKPVLQKWTKGPFQP